MIIGSRGAQHHIPKTEKSSALRALVGELDYWDSRGLRRSESIDEERKLPAAKDPGETERTENDDDEQSSKKESAHWSLRCPVNHRQSKLWGTQAASLHISAACRDESFAVIALHCM
jgi:hypothetical protein